MESINSVLKPCPFCGGEAVLFVENGVQVICLSCGVRTSLIADMSLGVLDGIKVKFIKGVSFDLDSKMYVIEVE